MKFCKCRLNRFLTNLNRYQPDGFGDLLFNQIDGHFYFLYASQPLIANPNHNLRISFYGKGSYSSRWLSLSQVI